MGEAGPATTGQKKMALNASSEQLKSCETTSFEVDAEAAVFAEDSPQDWSLFKRWSIVVAVSSMTMMSIFATNIITPSSPQILQTFDIQDNLYQTVLVSIWELGEGIGPFVAAPLSEHFGRSPVFHISNLLGLMCVVSCALSVNISMLVAFRFLGGLFLNAPTLAPAIIGDVIRTSERGKALAIGMGLRQIGFFAAPVVGGLINQSLGWRWTQWILAIALGVLSVMALIVVRETYAKRLRMESQRAKDGERSQITHGSHSDSTALWMAMTRPVQILRARDYDFSEGAVGLAYIPTNVGCVVAIVLYLFTSDRYLEYKKTRGGGISRPENRLVHMFLGSCTLPVGFLMFGWTAEYRAQYLLPLVGTGIIGFSLTLVILPAENYLVDAHEEHSASAVAACLILCAILGASFPLAGPPLYEELGLGWGNSLLALIAAVFIPIIALLIKYGQRLSSWGGVYSGQGKQ